MLISAWVTRVDISYLRKQNEVEEALDGESKWELG